MALDAWITLTVVVAVLALLMSGRVAPSVAVFGGAVAVLILGVVGPVWLTDAEEVMPILRVADAARAVRWYERLGFAQQWEHRFAPGLPAFVEIARGRVRLFLSEHEGDARPDTLVYLRLHDLDAVAAEFGLTPQDAPWGRELHLTDPDGNRLRIGPPAEQ
jgi:catechol 2,3-dioxygenase-like lactoylglutathione lyase family enzyme